MAKLWTLRCSFCKKSDAEVAKLVAGPGVRICDECVAIASRLMDAPPVLPTAFGQPSLRERIVRRIRRWVHVDNGRRLRSVATS